MRWIFFPKWKSLRTKYQCCDSEISENSPVRIPNHRSQCFHDLQWIDVNEIDCSDFLLVSFHWIENRNTELETSEFVLFKMYQKTFQFSSLIKLCIVGILNEFVARAAGYYLGCFCGDLVASFSSYSAFGWFMVTTFM